MPQQINLYSPIFLVNKRQFSAFIMFSVLVILIIASIPLCFYWTWKENSLIEISRDGSKLKYEEIKIIQASLNKIRQAPKNDPSILEQEVKNLTEEVFQKERIILDIDKGSFNSGHGHSDRLHLISQSIPPQAWVSEVKSDENYLEVSGFTLNPSALNEWVKTLSKSPLMEGQKLSTVKVEKVTLASPARAFGASAALSAASSTASSTASPSPMPLPFQSATSIVGPLPKVNFAPDTPRSQLPMPAPALLLPGLPELNPASGATRTVWSFRLLSEKNTATSLEKVSAK